MFVYKLIHLPLTIVASTYVCWFSSPSTHIHCYIPKTIVIHIHLCLLVYKPINIHTNSSIPPSSGGGFQAAVRRLRFSLRTSGRPCGGGESDAGHVRLLLRRICLQKGPSNGQSRWDVGPDFMTAIRGKDSLGKKNWQWG